MVARDQVGDVLFNAQVAQVEGASVTVDFLAPGRKKLVLMYARLSPLEDTPW